MPIFFGRCVHLTGARGTDIIQQPFANNVVDGDAPAGQRRIAALAIVAMVVLAVGSLRFAHRALPLVPLALPMLGALAVAAQLATAAMVYDRYRKSGLASLGILALAYVTCGFASLAFLLASPGVTTSIGLLRAAGRLAPWYYCAGTLLFAVQLLALVKADDAERRGRVESAALTLRRTSIGTLVTLALGGFAGAFASASLAKLSASHQATIVRLEVVVPVLALALLATFARVRRAFARRLTRVRLWLGVVVLAACLQLVVSTEFATAHFSVGWLVVLGLWIGGAVLMLATMLANVFDTLSRLSLKTGEPSEESASDDLTHLLNRRGFNVCFEEQYRRSSRLEESLALLIVDIDDFKRYNDTFGHQSGDRAIVSVARAISTMLRRAGDAGARIGGDQFAVLLPRTDLAGAVSVAERIAAAVQRLGIAQGAGARLAQITVTIGASSVNLFDDPGIEATASREMDALLTAADGALYEAKAAGRNCVRTREPSRDAIARAPLAG